MLPVYQHYLDNESDVGENELIKQSSNHESHDETLDLDKLANGDSSQIGDVTYYGGGFNPNKSNDPHNRYAVDNVGIGRDAAGAKGLEGSYDRAKTLAEKQTAEFFKWLDKNLDESCRKAIFESNSDEQDDRNSDK